jgi:hypothetical protein
MTEMRSGKGDDSFRFVVDVQEINGIDNCGDALEEPVLRHQGSAPKKKVELKGPNQKKILEKLREMALDSDDGRVGYDLLRSSLLEEGMSPGGFRNAFDPMLTSYVIRQDGPWVEVLDAV